MREGVLGGNGFIGRRLVAALDAPRVHEAPLSDLDALRAFVRGCDRIYHLAGKNREPPGGILRNNLVATGNLVLACRLEGVAPQIVLSSTQQVRLNPGSEYGLTKRIEEAIVMTHPSWCVVRLPNVYGPGGRPFYNSVVATFAHQAAKGEPLTVHDPSARREFLDVDDAVAALRDWREGEVVDVRGEEMTIGQVAAYLTTDLGKHPKLSRVVEHLTR